MLASIEREFTDAQGKNISVINGESNFESESSPSKIVAFSPQISQEKMPKKLLQKNVDSTLDLLEELKLPSGIGSLAKRKNTLHQTSQITGITESHTHLPSQTHLPSAGLQLNKGLVKKEAANINIDSDFELENY